LAQRPLLAYVPASGDSEDDCGEADGECRLAGETEVLGENLPQRHFCPSQNPTWPDPDLNPGRRGGKPASNRLSYGAALYIHIYIYITVLGQIIFQGAEEKLLLLLLYGRLFGPDRFFSFLIYTQSVGLVGQVISPSQGLYLHTE
jgi:hypothetical protein